MHPDRHVGARWLRALALAGLTLLGLLGIVGSGGGFPPCDASFCNTGPPPPMPTARVEPAYVTALVGTPVTYTVSTTNVSGSLSYQWLRRSAGSSGYVEIPGATGASYSLPGVNLADDGARLLAVVQSNSGAIVQAVGHLAVSATPGLVFQDGEFLAQDWLASVVVDPAPAGMPAVVTQRLPTGGNPAAFQRMSFQVPTGTGSVRVFYTSPAGYDPSLQGGIYVIDYSEDCLSLQPSISTYTESALVIEQDGRRFLSNTPSDCQRTQWGGTAGRASLTAADFRQFDGPACAAGASCPDYSASAPPMRFGYWRISFGLSGDVIAHGIDNWRVTVWRR